MPAGAAQSSALKRHLAPGRGGRDDRQVKHWLWRAVDQRGLPGPTVFSPSSF
jgi:hypothetical protein